MAEYEPFFNVKCKKCGGQIVVRKVEGLGGCGLGLLGCFSLPWAIVVAGLSWVSGEARCASCWEKRSLWG